MNPKNSAKKNSSQSSRPMSAVITIDVEGTKSINKPPTEDEIVIQDREGQNTMFLVEEVTVKKNSRNMKALAFQDTGSNVTMIRNELAKKLSLVGTDVKNKLVRTCGDVIDWETKSYKVPLLNSEGNVIILTAMGVEEISSEIKPAKVEPALKIFPQNPDPGPREHQEA